MLLFVGFSQINTWLLFEVNQEVERRWDIDERLTWSASYDTLEKETRMTEKQMPKERDTERYRERRGKHFSLTWSLNLKNRKRFHYDYFWREGQIDCLCRRRWEKLTPFTGKTGAKDSGATELHSWNRVSSLQIRNIFSALTFSPLHLQDEDF